MSRYLINYRICPQPGLWNELYKILKEEFTMESISPPLILAGWNYSNDDDKERRFKEHLSLIEYKDFKDGRDFLEKLKEEDWHHKGE
ncbi:hypothetical protein [Christiangramia echinicola]|uniref:Uncharacterized protein n=1 Tax=Christiangramia echinicola TaxID=279359 RepID=A0A1H1RK70_9FLAO|nr:hypothetical protein [Christiangramia echinicola]SDS36090.1 hypothetical protein SAMN04488552_2926 [Christiangramia echinicola]